MSRTPSRFTLLVLPALFTGCFEHEDGDDTSGGEETGGVVVEEPECDEDDRKPLALSVNSLGIQCEVPPDCVQLPEAVDRGLVTFVYDATYGLQLTNLSGADEICIDGWFLLSTDASQDSGFGDPDDDDDDSTDEGGDDDDDSTDEGGDDDDDSTDEGDDDDDDSTDEDECDEDEDDRKGKGKGGKGKHKYGTWGGMHKIGGRQTQAYGYAGGSAGGLSADNPSWWCVEKTQYTQAAADFAFTGAHMPAPLSYLALNETDLNANGVEDHVDTASGYVQTNVNLWDYMSANPVMAVGRDQNFFELSAEEEALVTLHVTNMGRVGGVATFVEVLPANVELVDVSVEPALTQVDEYGRTVMTFQVWLDPAVDTDYYAPTAYDMAAVSYTIRMKPDAACPLRHEGRAPEVTWTDSAGDQWTSLGSPLTASCCTTVF